MSHNLCDVNFHDCNVCFIAKILHNGRFYVEYAMAEVKRHLFKTSGIKQNQVRYRPNCENIINRLYVIALGRYVTLVNYTKLIVKSMITKRKTLCPMSSLR